MGETIKIHWPTVVYEVEDGGDRYSHWEIEERRCNIDLVIQIETTNSILQEQWNSQ